MQTITGLLFAGAALLDAWSNARTFTAGRHLNAAARLRLKAARLEHRGRVDKAAELRAIAAEHVKIAEELG